MARLGYHFEISDEAKSYIATKGYDQQYGARPLKRALQKYLEDPLAELIINAELNPGDDIRVDYDAENDKIVPTVLPKQALLTSDADVTSSENVTETPSDTK
jgi:ATP-dependent Clp protease ATP-binding subunit ClpC